jgi:protoporphyrinogen oxidase
MVKLVIGGGISGMLAALLLKHTNPKAEVILIEKSIELGGLLRSFDFGLNGRFDLGVHTMYETGLDDLDRLLYEIIPDGGWNKLSGVSRDYGGAWYSGQLHENTAYLDLRSNTPENYRRWVSSFFLESIWGQDSKAPNFLDYFTSHYGKTIATEVLAPLIRKFTGVDGKDSHRLAGKVVPLERIVLLPEEVVHSLMESPDFRKRIAVPDQRRLPEKWIPKRSAYYPTSYGMHRYIDAFQTRLAEAGVRVMLGTDLASIQGSAATLTNGTQISFDELSWTIHPIGLTKALGIDIKDLAFDPPRTTVISNFWLDEEPTCKDLYYAFSYDQSMKTHRFSCPHYFCEKSTLHGKYRLISELVGGPEDKALDWNSVAIEELQKMGITHREHVRFARSEVLTGGYPTLSEKNIQNIHVLRDRIKLHAPSNVKFFGMLSEDDLFFQTDIMSNIYSKIMK